MPLDTPDYSSCIEEQYAAAIDLMERLADSLLQGDRERLVIVPGNHDVDWNTARTAMQPVPDSEIPRAFTSASCGARSDWRWYWKERQAYRIVNLALYEQRLAPFNHAIAAFYAGTVAQREHYRLHELLGGRIAVVAFNSCVGNDCFAFQGAIHEDAVARAHLELHERNASELRVAVWHHSIEGAPEASDYMDASTVYALIGKGFRLGLHGHQHRAAMATRYVHLPAEERMAVVSGGSLCSGRYGLPTGVNRQFNVIEVADDLTKARVHVREMAIATLFAPARRSEFGGRSYVDVDWELPQSAGMRAGQRARASVLEAEAAIDARRFDDAVALLSGAAKSSSYGRLLLLRALRESANWSTMIEEFEQPQSIGELVAAATARAEIGEAEQAIAFLESHRQRLDLPDPTMQDLTNAFTTKARLT